MWIHLRLTVSEQMIQDFGAWLKSVVCKYLVVFEISKEGVEHYHCHFQFINDTKKPLEAFRKKLIHKFSFLTGNKQYALAITDNEYKHDCYICKGESLDVPPVVVFKSPLKYTDEYIFLCNSQYWKVNKEIKTLVKKKSFVRDIADMMESLDSTKPLVFIRKEIYDVVMSQLGTHGKSLDEIIVRRLVNGVMNILVPFKFSEFLYQRTFDQSERIDF